MARPASTSASARPRRTPVNSRNILTVNGKEPGYVYRVVNDTGDRINEFLDRGYELVDAKDVRVGDKRVNAASPEGSKAQVSVNEHGGKAFVMRIREDWYHEDQALKQAQVDELEKALKQQASSTGLTGTIKIE